ncbi:hypothetical protein [Tenacibaculum piscium]|uniref:hypothetical protein n=1 Tax=Tenacibaculum piscium TaxID=1458515 RepID=UPI001EFB5F4F|nr:hypothetical protein [Tenacibaculum piscium]MCG8184282.1 hypothetical protein [Tenacibaculum piscium]MCG8205550.1 hypothetical protein [Tenacibaculum piscium]
MRKTNSFKLAVVAVGMLAITSTVTAQVTAVDNKGTIKTLQGGNGISEGFDATTNTTTFKLGGTLTEATTITSDVKTGGTNYFAIDGLGLVDINTALPSVSAAGAGTLAAGLTAAGAGALATVVTNAGETKNLTGLTLMVTDEATGEVKKLLAEDAAKFLSYFNPAKVSLRVETSPAAAGINQSITVTGLVAADVTANPGRLFVYKNGVKLSIDTDFSVADDTVTISLPVFTTDLIEVQFTN